MSGSTVLLIMFLVGIAVSVKAHQTKIWELVMLTTFGLLLATTSVGGRLTGSLDTLGLWVGRVVGSA